MTYKQWLDENIPQGKTTLSVDAVEILIKLAWQEAVNSERRRVLESNRRPEGPYEIE